MSDDRFRRVDVEDREQSKEAMAHMREDIRFLFEQNDQELTAVYQVIGYATEHEEDVEMELDDGGGFHIKGDSLLPTDQESDDLTAQSPRARAAGVPEHDSDQKSDDPTLQPPQVSSAEAPAQDDDMITSTTIKRRSIWLTCCDMSIPSKRS